MELKPHYPSLQMHYTFPRVFDDNISIQRQIGQEVLPREKGGKGKIPHIFLIDQEILQILHFGTQLLGELQSFLL